LSTTGDTVCYVSAGPGARARLGGSEVPVLARAQHDLAAASRPSQSSV